MAVVPSLSIEFEQVGSEWLAVAPWGAATGATWEQAYTNVMRLRK